MMGSLALRTVLQGKLPSSLSRSAVAPWVSNCETRGRCSAKPAGRWCNPRRDYDRRRDGATVGVGPGGVTVGPRERCRTVTTKVERDDGRMVTRKERRCD